MDILQTMETKQLFSHQSVKNITQQLNFSLVTTSLSPQEDTMFTLQSSKNEKLNHLGIFPTKKIPSPEFSLESSSKNQGKKNPTLHLNFHREHREETSLTRCMRVA